MSNDCSNRIEIIGDKDVITRMFELVKSEARDWGKIPSPNKTEEENRTWLGLEFDFDKVIPYPEEYAKMDAEKKDSGYQAGGGDWCIKKWGTKWNATNASTWFATRENFEEVEGFSFSDYKDPACAIIYYTTAWSPALPVTAALSKQYPELSFKHTYEEEGLIGAGYQVWKAGELIAGIKPRDEDEEGDSKEVSYKQCLRLLLKTNNDEWDYAKLKKLLFDYDWVEDDDEDDDDEIIKDDDWSIRIKQDGTRILQEYRGHAKDVIIPEGTNIIGKYCFESSSVRSVVIPESVTEIKPYAFQDCGSLQRVNLPKSLRIIRKSTFSGCSLESISIPEGVKYIGEDAFSYNALTSVLIPDGVIHLGGFDHCKNLESINIPKSVKILTGFSGCAKLTSIKIPNIKILSTELFKNCTSLTDVDLEDYGRGSIVIEMFKGCSALKEIKIPEGVTRIDKNAFTDCVQLSSIWLPLSVAKIDKTSFTNCPNLVIHAPKGSYTIRFAKKQGISYIEE